VIGIKYSSAQNLNVNFEGSKSQQAFSDSRLEEHVLRLPRDKSELNDYTMKLQPWTSKIMKVMAINLTNLNLWVDSGNVETQFSSLVSSRQKGLIKYFQKVDTAIGCRENFIYKDVFGNMLEQLECLTYVKIDSNINCGNDYLLITILQKCPKLNYV
jgi:predicted AlkP superfamily phosphohydrolase/phosphomutase